MENKQFWYGIEGVEFIWHGEWSDPEVLYDGMLVNAPTVEDSMISMFCTESDSCELSCEFDDFMRENSDEVKELIQIAWESMPRISATVDDRIGEIVLLESDADELDCSCDHYTIFEADVCRQDYILKQFNDIDTSILSEVAANLWDLTDEFEGVCMKRLSAIILLCKFTVLAAQNIQYNND